MGIWVGIAFLLLVVLGVVTGLQRRTEFAHRIEAARRKQRTLAEALIGVQRETDFAESYQVGEAKEIAVSARRQVAELSTQFSESSRRLQQFKGWSTLFPSTEAYVGIARLLEEYQAVEQGIAALRGQLNRLDSLVKTAKSETGTHLETWNKVKRQIMQALTDIIPLAWQQEFGNIEAELTKLSIATDGVQRAERLERVAGQIQTWERHLPTFQVWAEWKAQGSQRRPLMEASVHRFEQIGAGQTQTCQALKGALSDLEHLLSLTTEQLRLPESRALTQRLGPSFTGVLNRASVLLNLLADKSRLQEAESKQRSRLTNLQNHFYDTEYQSAEHVVKGAEPEWFATYERKKQTVLRRVESLAVTEDVRQTPLNTLLVVDELLSLAEETTGIQSQLEAEYRHFRQVDATLEARMSVLADRFSEGLAKLAGVNLLDADEYKKLSTWQAELHQLQAANIPDALEIERLEQRINNEWKVIEAAVAARSSIDATLQAHLDGLVRHHRSSFESQAFEPGRPQALDSPGGLNMGGMAWTSLVLAEAALSTAAWSDWEDGF